MADGTFDPSQHLIRVNGNPYLEVRWKLVWLRDEHPDAEVLTDLVKREHDSAVFRCLVRLQTGGCATGYGSETAGDYPDYIEKAETKAIGRALNALGYGVPALGLPPPRQPTTRPQPGRPASDAVSAGGVIRPDRHSGASHKTAPTERRERAAADLEARQAGREDAQRPAVAPLGPRAEASSRQISYLRVVAREVGLEPDEAARRQFGCPVTELSRRQVSELIDWLQDTHDPDGG